MRVLGAATTVSGGETTSQTRTLQNAGVAYDASNLPRQFASGTTTATRTGTQSGTSYTSGTAAGGDLLLLGTWDGASWQSGGTTSTDSHFAYVAGAPTAPNFTLANQRATYTLLSATPVYTDRNLVGSVASATLSVDFFTRNTNSLGTLAVNLDLPRMVGGTTQATRYTLNGSLNGDGALLSGALAIASAACNSGLDSCLGGSAQGFFANTAGSKVGLTFQGSTANVGGFGGALAFGESGPRGPIPPTVGNMAANYVTSFAYINSIGSPAQQTTAPDGDRVFFTGVELTESRPRGSQPDIAKGGGVTAASAGAGGIGVPGSADFIGWGSWESGNITGTVGLPVISNVHYIVATPTTDASMPTSGTATYNLVGGSAPVSSIRGTGTLNSGTLTANFNNATVGALLNLGFGANNYNVGGTGQFRQPGNDKAVILSTPGNNGAPIAAVINGVFSGANAYRAGITYSVNGGLQLGFVNGAAVFQKAP